MPFFSYTDAFGIQLGDLYTIKALDCPLLKICQRWNTFTLEALIDNTAVFYQTVKTYHQLSLILNEEIGGKLIIDSFMQLGDRHYRLSLSESEVSIKGIGILETTEPAITSPAENQVFIIHNKILKFYFSQEKRIYEFDFVNGTLYIGSL